MDTRDRAVPGHSLRVAAIQMQIVAGDKDANLATIEAFVAQAAAQGVQLIVFPECCITGYWFLRNLMPQQLAELAEPLAGGRSVQRLVELAQQYNLTIGAGFVERSASGGYHNSYAVALPDGAVHCH